MSDPPRVMLIEDDADLVWVLQTFFEDHGYEVRAQSSYEAALPDLRAGWADVTIVDCINCDYSQLTETDRKRIREVAVFAPTIMHTARAWAEPRITNELGLVDFVPKPTDFAILLPAVERALEREN